jgi:hypothetical protein
MKSIVHLVLFLLVQLKDAFCSPMAFVLLSAICSQWMVVVFSAISACSLVVYGKRLNLGRWDWKFLLGTFGFSVTIGGIAWGLKLLGPSGAWLVDHVHKYWTLGHEEQSDLDDFKPCNCYSCCTESTIFGRQMS